MPRTQFHQPVALPEETYPCQIAAIVGRKVHTDTKVYYRYALALDPPRQNWRACIDVPEANVVASRREEFAQAESRGLCLMLERRPANSGTVTLGPVVAEDVLARVYIRVLRVLYQTMVFLGEVAVPWTETLTQQIGEATAVGSVEEDSRRSSERRVVTFTNTWTFTRGSMYDIEIWSHDMTMCLKGEGKVLRVDTKKGDDGGGEVRRIVLQVQEPGKEDKTLLVGELKTGIRSGPFVQQEVL